MAHGPGMGQDDPDVTQTRHESGRVSEDVCLIKFQKFVARGGEIEVTRAEAQIQSTNFIGF